MGLSLARDGRSSDIQDKPLLSHRDAPCPNMDHAAHYGSCCRGPHPRDEFPRPPMRCRYRISLYVYAIYSHGQCHGLMRSCTVGLGYLKFLAPPEWILREIETRLNLLGRLPHYVSVDQKTYGRFGVLPTNAPSSSSTTPMSLMGSTQRLGP